MGWFDEQLRERSQSDQEVFEESMFRMASVVLGRRLAGSLNDQRTLAKDALDDILKYYHYKPVEIPAEITDPEEQLEYCLRPHGIMRRSIKLEEGWYHDATGPILARWSSDNSPVALLPRRYTGYCYRNPETGKLVRLTAAVAEKLSPEGICFYRSFPLRSLSVKDLIQYLIGCLNVSDLVVLILLTLLVTLVGMLNPNITLVLTGFVLESGSVSLLIGTAVMMVCAIIAGQVMNAVRELSTSRIERKTSLPVEAALMMRVINLPAPFFRKYSSGELSTRLNAVQELCEMILSMVFSTGLASLSSLLYITQIFRFAPALVVPALIIILATLGVSLAGALLQMRVSRALLEHEAEDNGLAYSLIGGVQKIRLAGAEKRAFAHWAESYSNVAQYTYNAPLFLRVQSAITLAISLAGTITMYYLAVSNGVKPSEYLAFNSAYGTVIGAFTSLSGIALTAARIKPILEMAEPILNAQPESAKNRAMVTHLSGSIELNNVSFRYTDSTPYILDDISLKIRPGQYVAIVGSTGCGKSTLMRLLLGFETPEKGAIYYDGRDMSTLDLRSLRRHIGSVTQDGSLFQGDIYSNIVITSPQLSVEAAWEAAEIAGIAQDIREMPMQMFTVISDGQGGISGGQKQRLMIARAVAPKPRILMFDEATSALDNETQRQVSEALDQLKCTRIVIAHRLSTIRNCDRILVLDKGKIIEDGTYNELIAQNGFFADLVARQRLDSAS